MTKTQVSKQEDPVLIQLAVALITSLSEPVVVVNREAVILAANEAFSLFFPISEKNISTSLLFDLFPETVVNTAFIKESKRLFSEGRVVKNIQVNLNTGRPHIKYEVNANLVQLPGQKSELYLFSFKIRSAEFKNVNHQKLLTEILAETPALICTLRGPEHIFELANDKYLELFEPAEIIGKKVKDAIPEVAKQGFLKQLDKVYTSGKTYVGKEVLLRLPGKNTEKLLDYIYEPLLDEAGAVEGIFVHAIDVTDKVLTKRKLENSKKELSTLIDLVPVIVWITNAEGKGSFLNKNWYNFTGQSRKLLFSEGWFQAVHPEERTAVEQEFRKAHQEQREFNMQYRLRTKEGNYRWVVDKGHPKFGEKKEFQGLVGSVIDVHEDRLKEIVIREKEHLARTIVEEATVATALYLGRDMHIEFANNAMFDTWGKDRSVLGKTIDKALPELEGQPFFEYLQTVYDTGEMHWGKEDRAELVINGELTVGYFNYTFKPLRDRKGVIYGILHMSIDVTEMVESKNWLKEREKHFRLMADLMPEKVVNTNAEGEAFYFNRNWIEFTNIESEALRDRKWTSFVHPDDTDEFWQKWNYSLATGNSFEMELRLINAQGDYVWHLSRAESVRDEQEQILMWIATNTDIQNLKEEEKRKGDFLKMVSHELKTPVTSIKGYVQMLLGLLKTDKPLESLPLKPSLERVNNQIVRLTRLIADVLDISRLEDDKLELKLEVFDLNTLVHETIQDIKLTNTQYNLEVFPAGKSEVYADKDRIGQVLINFVTNAIKYSPESKDIEIHILRQPDNKVAVSVRDSGIGIEPKEYRNIFKRFYRIGVESEETYAGFGLGLYLANEIIDRHNGHIEVSNNENAGSNFTFVLSSVS